MTSLHVISPNVPGRVRAVWRGCAALLRPWDRGDGCAAVSVGTLQNLTSAWLLPHFVDKRALDEIASYSEFHQTLQRSVLFQQRDRLYAGQGVVQFARQLDGAHMFAIKFFAARKDFDEEADIYQNSPLNQFMPKVHKVVGNDDQSIRDPYGGVMSPFIVMEKGESLQERTRNCLLYTSPSPRDRTRSRMPSSA